ncbi:MAG: PfkB family carbohydrate kinase [Treponema sp.]|nr:PfkB family carbohydrate kinase [Treponema sp.]
MTHKAELLCIGNALIDIFATVPEHFFAQYALSQPAQHCDYHTVMHILEAIPQYTVCSGGGAANVAKIAAHVGIRTAFVGTVGSDKAGSLDTFGTQFSTELRAAGVTPFLQTVSEPTGICVLLKTKTGKSRIVACPSAALKLESVPEELVNGINLLVLEGFILDHVHILQPILTIAEKQGIPIALDGGSPLIVQQYARQLINYCRTYPFLLFMNEAEANAWYETVGSDYEDMYAFIKSLTKEGGFPIIAVKLAGRGAKVFANDCEYHVGTTFLVSKESTGAGDAFCAAFISAWLQNRSIEKCTSLANKAASIVLNVPGTALGTHEKVQLSKLLSPSFHVFTSA